ncbi:hypothetical protein OAS39_09045 [Pirellulales bacterium]|nr:hypothetical protein [Pirellulales bacterium]
MEQYHVEHASQIRTSLELLLRYPQLLPPKDPSHSIPLRDAILSGAVIYCSLYAVGEHEPAASIAGLIIYSISDALLSLLHEARDWMPHPAVILDEYHMVQGEHMEILFGLIRKQMSLHVAYQSSSQLTPSMASLVSEMTFCRILFTLSSEADFQELELRSKDHFDNWGAKQRRLGTPAFHPGPNASEGESQYRDKMTPRNLLMELTAHEDFYLILLNDGKGHREPIVATRQHDVPWEQHERDSIRPLNIIGAEFIGAPSNGNGKPQAPPWEARHAAPVEGERAVWQANLEALWEEKERALKL